MALFRKADLQYYTIKKSFNYETAESILKREAATFSVSKTYDIFLSHSYSDANDILKIKQIIEDMGFSTYVDWIEDRQLNRSNVNKSTAATIRYRMTRCKSLFYVTSDNASSSKWMPWELGCFDGLKGKVAILPILQQNNYTDSYEGQEYLGLYPYVTKDKPQGGSSVTLWIHDSSSKYVSFRQWLEGKNPYIHIENT
jgi:hypothetical protein